MRRLCEEKQQSKKKKPEKLTESEKQEMINQQKLIFEKSAEIMKSEKDNISHEAKLLQNNEEKHQEILSKTFQDAPLDSETTFDLNF